MKPNILIVDDEPANLRLLERLFKDEYEVKTALSGQEALELLVRFDAALIISDQRMPGMTGIKFLRKAAELRPQTVRIILTGYTDVSDLVEAINSSVIYRYITKPWVNTDLLQTVRSGIQLYATAKRQHLLQNENARLRQRLESTVHGFMGTLKEMIEQKNNELSEHCKRTANYAGLIGEELDLEANDLEQLILAAMIHEAPALRIPFYLDLNRSALTPEQFSVTRHSYENGLRLISSVPDLQDVANIIAYQHEHFDGNGLFQGLEGEKIPIASRILAVANAFDAITTTRNATVGRMSGHPIERLRNLSGRALDPAIVEACLRLNLNESENGAAGRRPAAPERVAALVNA